MVKCPAMSPLGVPWLPVVVKGCMPKVPSEFILNSVAAFALLDICSVHLFTELVLSVSLRAHSGKPLMLVHSLGVTPFNIWNA